MRTRKYAAFPLASPSLLLIADSHSWSTTLEIFPRSLLNIPKLDHIMNWRPLLSNFLFHHQDPSWVFGATPAPFSNCPIAHTHIQEGLLLVCMILTVPFLCRGKFLFLAADGYMAHYTHSRVGVVGPNGAGKSTLIKLLTACLPVILFSYTVTLIYRLRESRLLRRVSSTSIHRYALDMFLNTPRIT